MAKYEVLIEALVTWIVAATEIPQWTPLLAALEAIFSPGSPAPAAASPTQADILRSLGAVKSSSDPVGMPGIVK